MTMRFTRTSFQFFSIIIIAMLLGSCERLPWNRAESWSYTFTDVNDTATLRLTGVTIVFEGEQVGGMLAGSLQVGGTGFSSGRGRIDDKTFKTQYSNGIATMRFLNYHCRLLYEGSTLCIQGTEIDLSRGKKLVTVKEDGSVITEDIMGKRPILSEHIREFNAVTYAAFFKYFCIGAVLSLLGSLASLLAAKSNRGILKYITRTVLILPVAIRLGFPLCATHRQGHGLYR